MRIHGMGPRVCYSADGAAGGGAGAAGAGDAGNPGGGADKGAAPGNGSPAGGGDAKTWLDGLTPENRQVASTKGWTDPNKGLDSYRELESKVGKAIFLPGENATPEEWAPVFDKLGRPKTPTEYKFERPAGLAANAPYNSEAVEVMKTLAHTAGLSPHQAKIMHDGLVMGAAEKISAQAALTEKAVSDAHTAITQKWGDPEGENYKRNNELANRAIRQLGNEPLVAELRSLGILTGDDRVARAPNLVFALAKIGEMNFAEDSLYANVGGFQNPFADASENPDEQGKIIRKDPDRARALIRAAGKEPAEWFHQERTG